MAPELAPGLVLSGRYRLAEELGRGGAGVVWAASDGSQPVALKILSQRASADDIMRKRFLREARALSDLRHPGIVDVREVTELDGGTPVIVMEALSGENLRRKLERERVLPLGEAAGVLARVASAVAYAHARGVVHRDLKPENIFLCTEAPGATRVKVLDFGIAKLLAANANVTSVVTEIGVGLGTLHYAAPEQILSAAEVDHRADIWSLGVILYECLSGFRPIEGATERDLLRRVLTDAIPTLSLVAPGVPQAVSELVARMLTRLPEERLSDAREVEGLLGGYAAAGAGV